MRLKILIFVKEQALVNLAEVGENKQLLIAIVGSSFL